MKVILLFMFASFPLFANQDNTPPPVAPAAISESSASNLRKREHRLSWEFSSNRLEVDVKDNGDYDSNSGELSIGYGYNWGRYELGVDYGFTLSENDSNETTIGQLALYGRFNFIDNQPGENLVPYLAVALLSRTEKLDPEDGNDIEFEGSGLGLQLGLSWFPLGEIYAVEFALTTANIQGDLKGSGNSIDTELKGTGISIGYSIYF